MNTGYRIPDEPRPGALERVIVNPLWPLLALMLVGPWLGLPWLVFNSVALGSPSLRGDIAAAMAAIFGTLLFGWILMQPGVAQSIPRESIKYWLLIVVSLHLGFGYLIYLRQQSAYSIFEYYGGKPAMGYLAVVVAMFFLDPRVAKFLGDLGLPWMLLR
jgi:hypothetical protein